MEIFGVENESEEKGGTNNGEDMKKGAAFSVGVMETDFFDGVEFPIPNKPFGVDFAAETIKGETDGNRFG